MSIGQVFAPEGRTYADPVTGVTVRQLTDWRCHNHHTYFTNNGLYAGGRRLLIGSHRHNAENFFGVELDSGTLTQLTDFGPEAKPGLQGAFINPTRDEAYFNNQGTLTALDLKTGQQRELYRRPEGYRLGNCSCTADGRTVCVAVSQDLSGQILMDLGHGYVGFAEYWAARPHCMIVAIDVETGLTRTAWEEDCWVGHVNTSPALANVLSFCHEGPWSKVDQRMWVLDIPTGQATPLRPQVPGETIGHEYWFADGQRVGYHGTKDGVHLFGFIGWDNTGQVERPFPHGSTHFHSLDETLIIGDGGTGNPFLLLWQLAGEQYAGPRRLLRHRGSFHIQIVHVHPRMFTGPDGTRRIAFTADHNGYGNVFLVDVPPFESLPEVEAR